MTTTALTIVTLDGKPRVLDTDLAARLGMARPTNIRTLIEANRAELESFGPCTGRVHAHPNVPGRTSTAYHLNEEQALLIVMFSRTDKAVEARREIITVFQAWRRGALQPVLPDFSNPVLAARAWADAEEGRMLADHRAREENERATLAEAKVDELTPLATVGMLAANSEHCLMAVLRGMPHVNVNKVRGALADMGILRRVLSGKFRVNRGRYGKHFLEGVPDTYGGVVITPTEKGRILLGSLYRDGRLPMLKGHKPQRILKAIGAA